MSMIINPFIFGNAPVPWTPAQLTTAIWFDADDSSTITEVSGAISQWDDKSGNARNASQGTAANRPVVAAGVLNGRDVVRFDGVNDLLSTATFTGPVGSTGLSTAMVLNKTGEPVNFSIPLIKGAINDEWSYVLSSNAGAISAAMRRRLNWRHTTAANQTIQSTSNYGLDGAIILTGTMSDSGMEFYRSGGADGTAPAAAKAINKNTAVLIGDGGSAPANRFQGDIAEIVLVHSVLSTTDREKLEGYLAHKWGLTSLLPGGHPYKTNPPFV